MNYAIVYNYDYCIAHNPDVKQAFLGDPAATFNQFIIAGMDEGRQVIDTFDVRSYRLANPELRVAYLFRMINRFEFSQYRHICFKLLMAFLYNDIQYNGYSK